MRSEANDEALGCSIRLIFTWQYVRRRIICFGWSWITEPWWCQWLGKFMIFDCGWPPVTETSDSKTLEGVGWKVLYSNSFSAKYKCMQLKKTPFLSWSLQVEPPGTASIISSSLLSSGPKEDKHARNWQIQLDLERREKVPEKQTSVKRTRSQIRSPMG